MPNNNVLTDEQILKIVRKTLKGGNDRDKLSSASFVKLARALEAAHPGQPETRADVTDTQRLDWLHDECCDLRSISVPTGGDDYDINWIVIQHHMAAPHEREIGRGFTDDPRSAIDAARTGGA